MDLCSGVTPARPRGDEGKTRERPTFAARETKVFSKENQQIFLRIILFPTFKIKKNLKPGMEPCRLR